MSPGPATALLAAAATAAFLIDRDRGARGDDARAPRDLPARPRPAPLALHRRLADQRASRVIVISPLTWSSGGGTLLWEGPTLPVIGPLDISTDEIQIAVVNGLRLAVVGLAFSAYTLLVDHDRLVSAAGFARRSALAVALATRLVPSLERDAAGFAESVRGRGVELHGARGYATLLSPLVAGSLERATGLAEAMEARGFGRSGATRAPRPAVDVDRSRRARGRRRSRGGGGMALASRLRPLVRLSRRRSGRARRLARAARGRGGGAARAVRQRQVDAPARARRPRAALPWRPVLGSGRGRTAATPARPAPPSSRGRWRRSSRIPRTRS